MRRWTCSNLSDIQHFENNWEVYTRKTYSLTFIHDRQYDFRHRCLILIGDLLTFQRTSVRPVKYILLCLTWCSNRKLPTNGLSPELFHWIKNFLTDRSFQVVVDGVSFVTQSTKAGVSQGSIFSPFIFLLHLNDPFSSSSLIRFIFSPTLPLHSS